MPASRCTTGSSADANHDQRIPIRVAFHKTRRTVILNPTVAPQQPANSRQVILNPQPTARHRLVRCCRLQFRDGLRRAQNRYSQGPRDFGGGNNGGRDWPGLGLGPVLLTGSRRVGNWRLFRALESAAEEQCRIHELGGDPHASFVRQQRQSRVVRCGLAAAENNSGRLQACAERWCRSGLEI
jgi:hypothetical protein